MTGPAEPGRGEPVSVVFLHGYDARPGVWLPFVERLEGLLGGGVGVTLLTGPVELGEELAAQSFAWFDDGHDRFPTVAEAVEWVRSQLVGPSVLVGFSQGGAVALACAFDPSGPGPVAGVVAMGAFLPDDVAPVEFGGPVAVVHGEEDLVVDVMFAERLHRQAVKAGVPTSLVLHPGGHEIPLSAAELVASTVQSCSISAR
jgi:predicted esterase